MQLLRPILLGILILFMARIAHSDCWEITSREGKISIDSEVWQYKDKGPKDKNIIQAFVNDAETIVDFNSISSITLDKTDQSYVVGEIVLTSGTRGAFKIYSVNKLNLITQFGDSIIVFGNIKSIFRCGKRGMAPAQTSVATAVHDSIILKNGDILSGEIITRTFNIKSSYADLDIGASNIEAIDLEGGGQNVDVVQLRSGDKISGVLTNEVIQMRLPIGSEVTFQRDKIKTITFKRRK